MTTQNVADQLVKLVREGRNDQAIEQLYSDAIVSVERGGFPHRLTEGKAAVIEKGIEFSNMLETVHSSEVSDPLVADKFFTITMKMNATVKGAPHPMDMEEVCLYQVEEGKIIREEFFFSEHEEQ